MIVENNNNNMYHLSDIYQDIKLTKFISKKAYIWRETKPPIPIIPLENEISDIKILVITFKQSIYIQNKGLYHMGNLLLWVIKACRDLIHGWNSNTQFGPHSAGLNA